MLKQALITAFFIGTIQTGYSQPSDAGADGFKTIQWLEGTWKRTKANKTPAYEHWVKGKGNELVGYGFRLNGPDTVFTEKLRIIARDGNLYYVADVPENGKLVYFKFIELGTGKFVCENMQHDFPKRIDYRLEGRTMKVTISGDGKASDFIFERM